jgi:hypothetical protein
MEVEQGKEEDANYGEELSEENLQDEETEGAEEATTEYKVTEEMPEQKPEKRNVRPNSQEEDRSSFIHGLSVGLGIGCIATFIIMWITVFFSPQLPQTLTYESMLAIFIYPLIYLLAVGLVALTAGIVREYYAKAKL